LLVLIILGILELLGSEKSLELNFIFIQYYSKDIAIDMGMYLDEDMDRRRNLPREKVGNNL
jgi:hypothetical protein